MASAPVDIPVQVKGLSDLEKLLRRTTALEKEVTRLQGKLPTAANGMRATGRAAAGASGGVNKLSASLKGIAGQFAAFAGLSVGVGATFQSLAKADKASAALRTLGLDSKELGTMDLN